MTNDPISSSYLEKRIPSGSYVGNGVSQTIVLGYRPKRVKIYSDDNNFIMRLFDGQSNTHGIGRMTSAGAQMHRGLKLTDGGISITDTGFSIGNNVAVNENGKTFYWEAS